MGRSNSGSGISAFHPASGATLQQVQGVSRFVEYYVLIRMFQRHFTTMLIVFLDCYMKLLFSI